MAGLQIASARTETQVWDEGFELGSGYSYLKTGKLRFNLEQPPLAKLLAALPLVYLNPQLPVDDPSWINKQDIEFGIAFLYHNRVPADTMLMSARSMIILLTVALGVLVAAWARRELALVLTADVVDHQLNEYLECQGLNQQFGANERILVCITPRANMQEMMEIAQIMTQRFHGELIVAYVNQPNISSEDQTALDARLAIASAAGAHIEILEGDDPADALLEFARSRGITQLFVGHSQRTGLSRLWGSPIGKLIRDSRGMDVRVFPQ